MLSIETTLLVLEDHFARTGEWWALCQVMRVKRLLRISLHRRVWL